MSEVLYHPHFEPSLSWLRSSLLVYDKIYSIVPTGASYAPSEAIKCHLEKLPDTFETLSPKPLDIVEEYFVLEALGHAFRRIASFSELSPTQVNRLFFKSSDVDSFEQELEILGIVKLHEFKIAYSVYQMLENNGLIYGQSADGFAYVDEQAASLIVSFLAQRMSNRLAMRTITDGEAFFYLSAACNVIEAGNPLDSRGVLASSVLQFHIPENIGDLSVAEFAELRNHYEDLREAFPLYLRDLGELIQIDDIRNVPDLNARIKKIVDTIDRDMARIKQTQIGSSIRRWLPIGIGSAVTIAAAILPDNPSVKYVTGAATIAVQILTEALKNDPIPSRLEGTQSLLLSAKEDILKPRDMASSIMLPF